MSESTPNDPDATQLETLVDPSLSKADALPADAEVILDLSRFRVIRLLGEGGMGQVFLAEQTEPVQREVAVKVIRSRLNTSSNLARFDVERQALAQMNHPAIAQVFDAGTTPRGHPYFVMEYIDGIRLDHFCRDQRLDVRERLALFIRICQGVQHAHARGIIHRDLKPANILVRRIDGLPAPKIIDFGIAVAAEQQRTETGSRRDLVGTPRYMSPEQFRVDRAVVDGRSDVYSLGVVLYELLVDQPPLDQEHYETASQTGNSEALAARLPPPAPSSRLSMNTDSCDAVAAARRTSIRRLQRRLKTDLDAVVLKALESDPEARHHSPQALADDLQAVLDRRPVSAIPNTAGYRLRRFVRRNLLAVGSASAILLALIAGLTAATLGMLEAQRQFQIAEQRQQELEQVVGFQQSMLEGVDPQAMGIGLIDGLREQYADSIARRPASAPSLPDLELVVSQISGTELARRMLDQHLLTEARESIERDFEGQPGLQARLYTALHSVYSSLGIAGQLPALTETLLLRLEQSGESDPGALLEARFWQASAWFDVGERERSLAALESLAIEADALVDDPRRLAVRVRANMAVSLVETGQPEAAVDQITTALTLARERYGDDDPLTIRTLGNVGYVYARAGNLQQAQPIFRQEVEAWRAQDDQKQLASSLLNLAASLGATGQLDEALAVHEETLGRLQSVFGRRHPISLRAMNNMAATLVQLQRTEEALPLHMETLRLRAETLGAAHPETLRSRLNLGAVMNQIGRREEALDLVEEVVEQRRLLLGIHHLDTLQAEEILASILMDLERHDESAAVIARVLAERREQLGESHHQTRAAMFIMGLNYLEAGRPEDSLPLLEEAHALDRANLPDDHRRRVESAVRYYQNLLALGQSDQAAAFRAEALSVLERSDRESLPPELARFHDILMAPDQAASDQVQNDQ